LGTAGRPSLSGYREGDLPEDGFHMDIDRGDSKAKRGAAIVLVRVGIPLVPVEDDGGDPVKQGRRTHEPPGGEFASVVPLSRVCRIISASSG